MTQVYVLLNQPPLNIEISSGNNIKLYTYYHRDRNLQMSQIKVTFMRSINISRHHHSNEHLPIPSRWWESWPSSAIINANIFFSRVGISKNSSPSFKDVDYLSAIPKAIRSTFVHKAAKFHAPIADNYDLKLSIFLLAISILLNSDSK